MIPIPTQVLVLITQAYSTKALAVDSVTARGQPFALQSDVAFADDRRTRVMVFALNVEADTPQTVALRVKVRGRAT